MSEHVLIERDKGVLQLRMNRPSRKNALTPEMFLQIAAAIEQAEDDRGVSAIVLLGCGGNFTSGNDVSAFPAPPAPGEETPPMRLLRSLVGGTIPVVAGVDGVAAGIGATVLLHCDSVIVTQHARLILPFINLALVPEAGSSLLLPERLGYTRAADLILRGNPIDGARAYELGIASALAEPDDLERNTLETASDIARWPRKSLRQSKRLLKGDVEPLLRRIEEEQDQLFECFSSPEHKEAVTAFAEKRPPDFSQFDDV